MFSDTRPVFIQGTAAERAALSVGGVRLGAFYFESDTGDFYHVTLNPGTQAHTWTQVAGGGGSSAFPLKFVVDSRLAPSPPTGLYSDLETAITAANAATKPAVVQIYPGTYTLGAAPVAVSAGVSLMGMGGNPIAVTIVGALQWALGGGGGLFNLRVSTPNGAGVPAVRIVSAAGGDIFTIANAIVTNQDVTSPFALQVANTVNSGFLLRIQSSLLASFTGTGVSIENGTVDSTTNDIRGGGSGRSIDVLGGTYRSYGDRYERTVQLGGGVARMVSSFIDAASSAGAPIAMVGTSTATLDSPYLIAGNVSNWITATGPVTVNASNVQIQGNASLTADANITFPPLFAPQRVRQVTASGVASFPPMATSLQHAPVQDNDALTLPALGAIMTGSVLYVQNTSSTLRTTLTAGAGTTIDGSATLTIAPLGRAILIYDVATTQYLSATTSVVFGGDLANGSLPNTQTVIGIQTRPVAATAPTVGQSLMWNGTQWAPGQQPIRYIVDPTLPTGANTPAGYFQTLDSALALANAVGASVPVVIQLMPGTYTGLGANFTLSRFIKLQGMSDDPRAVVLSLPVSIGAGATQAALANLTINYSGNAPSLVVGVASASIRLDNCEIYQGNLAGSNQAVLINSSALGAYMLIRNCRISSSNFYGIEMDSPGIIETENTLYQSNRTDTNKLAVAINHSTGLVQWTSEDSIYYGGIQHLSGSTTFGLFLDGDAIDVTGSSTVGLQFGGTTTTILAGSNARNLKITNGTALFAINPGTGGIATTFGVAGLALPNGGQVGDFVRPSVQNDAEFPARYIGGSDVVIDLYARTVVFSNTGNAQLPSLTSMVQGTRILIRRDTGSGGANLTVALGEYLNGTLNGTFAIAAGQSVWAVAYRVGYANPTWEIFA